MAKRRGRQLSQSRLARIRRKSAHIKKAAAAQKKRAPKIRQYNHLVKDFIAKQKEKGSKESLKDLRNSPRLKKLVRDLRKGSPAEKKAALQETIRGDKVRDWRPYLNRWHKGEL